MVSLTAFLGSSSVSPSLNTEPLIQPFHALIPPLTSPTPSIHQYTPNHSSGRVYKSFTTPDGTIYRSRVTALAAEAAFARGKGRVRVSRAAVRFTAG